MDFVYFSSLGLKVVQVAAYITTNILSYILDTARSNASTFFFKEKKKHSSSRPYWITTANNKKNEKFVKNC